MKEIILTKGQLAYVDDEDYEYITSFGNWYSGERYAQRHIIGAEPRKVYLMHREIWKRYFTLNNNEKIDHRDGNGFNNCKSNLRIANSQQNMFNSRLGKRNKRTGYKGVSIDNRNENPRFQALMRINGKLKHIAMFKTAREAAIAYDLYAQKIQGEYSCPNIKNATEEEINKIKLFLIEKGKL